MSPRAPETAEKQHLIHTQQVGRHIKRRSPRVNATSPTDAQQAGVQDANRQAPQQSLASLKRRTHLSLNTAPRNGPAPPTQHRRKAVETLAEALTNAMRRAAGKKALETIRQRDYLDWHTYVEALQQEFAQELRRRISPQPPAQRAGRRREEQMQAQRRYRLPSDGGRSIVAIDRTTSSAQI